MTIITSNRFGYSPICLFQYPSYKSVNHFFVNSTNSSNLVDPLPSPTTKKVIPNDTKLISQVANNTRKRTARIIYQENEGKQKQFVESATEIPENHFSNKRSKRVSIDIDLEEQLNP